MHEEVEHSVVELARRLRMEDHHTQHVAVARAMTGTATIDWKRSSSSSGTYFMRGSSSAWSRMNSGVFVARDPPRQALVHAPAELADQMRVARRRRPQHQALPVQEVDEGGVAAGRVGRDLDDAVQHAVEVERGRDRLDDGVERLVFALYAGKSVAAARHR